VFFLWLSNDSLPLVLFWVSLLSNYTLHLYVFLCRVHVSEIQSCSTSNRYLVSLIVATCFHFLFQGQKTKAHVLTYMVFNVVPFLSLSRLKDYVFLLPSTSWCYFLVLKEDCRFYAHINFSFNVRPYRLETYGPIILPSRVQFLFWSYLLILAPRLHMICSVTFRVIVGLILFALGNVPDDDETPTRHNPPE